MASEEILYDVTANLKRLTNLEDVTFNSTGKGEYDLTINGITFFCVVRNQVNKANYNLLLQQLAGIKELTDKPLLVVARHFVPELLDNFSKDGVNVVDSSGNCNIQSGLLYIRIIGQKGYVPKEAKGKAFNEAGLKLIFFFLNDETLINKPYRKISDVTGASLGTINNVMDELGKSRYLITTEKGRLLKNKKELLDVWQTYYNQMLKPKLLLKEMEFTSDEGLKDWEDIVLPDGMCWGGESGAYMLDGYLTPEQFDIYTNVPSTRLVLTRKVKIQEKGRIHVYRKFWNGEMDCKTAPKVVIYADLMGSGNSRCIEAAQRLVENGI